MTASLISAVLFALALPPVPEAPGPDAWTFREELARPEAGKHGAALPVSVTAGKTPWLKNRISRCFFGPIKRPPFNRDELADDIDYYPDEYLKRLAREGVNGLWLTGELRELAETSFTKRDPLADRRIAKLNRTVEKCAKYGIKTWLFMIEPKIVPVDDPLFREHPELFSQPTHYRGRDCMVMCSSLPACRRYLEESTRDLFTRVPGLGGFINISHGERTTSCLSYLYATNDFRGHFKCPLCTNIPPWHVHCQALGALAAGMKSANPSAEAITWPYHSMPLPTRAEWVRELADHVPPNCIFQYNFESGALKEQLGKVRQGGDYWLSWEGPSDNFREMARRVRAKEPRLSAKIQVGCSHEVATVPFVPAPGLLYRKFKAMKEVGVTDTMMCWYFGNYPGTMNKAAGYLAYEDFNAEDENSFLLRLAQDDWGGESQRVVRVWQAIANGYRNYPMSNCFQYYGPVHAGVAWPLYPDISARPLEPTWEPYRHMSGDVIGECLENHALDEALALLRRATDSFDSVRGDMDALAQAFAGNREREGDMRVMRALAIQFAAAREVLAFYAARRDKDVSGMHAALAESRRLTLEMIPLAEADSRLGFHSEAESHLYHPRLLRWRLAALGKAERRLADIQKTVDAGGDWPLSEFESAAPTFPMRVDADGGRFIEGKVPREGDVAITVFDRSFSAWPLSFAARADAEGRFSLRLRDGLDAGWVQIRQGSYRWPALSEAPKRLRLGNTMADRFGRLVEESRNDVWHRQAAESLFERWCEGLYATQIREGTRPEARGALMCPACGFLHGRAGDAVYPFVRMWRKTGESRWLDAARDVVDWTERNFTREGGCYVNDLQSSWLYTGVFSQIALGRTLQRYGDALPRDTARRWRMIFDRLSAWALDYFRRTPGPNVNYFAAYCEAMALAWKISGDEKFRDAAASMAHGTVMKCFTEDGFLFGEGRPIDGKSAVRGLHYIDIGYNLEESLPALAAAAEMLGDAELAKRVEASAKAHAEFLLPDGAIDNAAGSRSVKWTYYGSRTSDGALPLWAWCARRGVPWGVRAIGRTLALLSRCTGDDGLLAGGLDYAAAGEPPCVHHTFTHVKALAELLEEGAPERVASAELPREIEYGCKHVDALDVDLVSVGPWRVTFSSNDAPKGDRRAMVGGGAPVVVWHMDRGLVAAGTMARFYWVEAHNMQGQRHDLVERSLTPRMEVESEQGPFSNICDAGVKVKSRFANGVFVSETDGVLTSWNPEKLQTNGRYRIAYRITRSSFSIDASADVPYSFVFPVRAVAADGLRVSASGSWSVEPTARGGDAFSTIGGFLMRYRTLRPDVGMHCAICVE